jgi:hypothetical protein
MRLVNRTAVREPDSRVARYGLYERPGDADHHLGGAPGWESSTQISTAMFTDALGSTIIDRPLLFTAAIACLAVRKRFSTPSCCGFDRRK